MFGNEAVERLAAAHVLVIGVGGVGAYAAEMLARAGVGELTLVDGDMVSLSNINRQLIAMHSTVGRCKVNLLAERLTDINPSIRLHPLCEYIHDDITARLLDAAHYDFVADAIDTLSPKVYLLHSAYMRRIPTVSSMGSGGKLDPTQVRIADIAATEGCRLARAVRKRLHRLGVVSGITAVYSAEPVASDSVIETEGERNKRSNTGTVSYMPAVFGCCMASHIIRLLTSNTRNNDNGKRDNEML